MRTYRHYSAAWFKEQGVPYFFWWTGGDTSSKDLEERLAKRGLISMEAQTEEVAKGVLSSEQGAPCMIADCYGPICARQRDRRRDHAPAFAQITGSTGIGFRLTDVRINRFLWRRA